MGHCQDNGSVSLYGSGGEMRDDFCGPEHSLAYTHRHIVMTSLNDDVTSPLGPVVTNAGLSGTVQHKHALFVYFPVRNVQLIINEI